MSNTTAAPPTFTANRRHKKQNERYFYQNDLCCNQGPRVNGTGLMDLPSDDLVVWLNEALEGFLVGEIASKIPRRSSCDDPSLRAKHRPKNLTQP